MKLKFLKTKLIYISYIFLIITFLPSCLQKPNRNVGFIDKKVVISAKRIQFDRGNSEYIIGFTNNEDLVVNFGTYSNYKVGDTMCLQCRKDGWYDWKVVKCKK
jgi:hypothetical protein